MPQRIKGLEVLATVSGPGGIEDFTARVSLDLAIQMEILEEAYLGEGTKRKDSIFNGITGSIDLHLDNAEFFRFLVRIVNKAKRRGAAIDQYNMLVRFSFPNGETARMLMEDIFFGEIPINTGGRDEYVAVTVPFEAGDVRFIIN